MEFEYKVYLPTPAEGSAWSDTYMNTHTHDHTKLSLIKLFQTLGPEAWTCPHARWKIAKRIAMWAWSIFLFDAWAGWRNPAVQLAHRDVTIEWMDWDHSPKYRGPSPDPLKVYQSFAFPIWLCAWRLGHEAVVDGCAKCRFRYVFAY